VTLRVGGAGQAISWINVIESCGCRRGGDAARRKRKAEYCADAAAPPTALNARVMPSWYNPRRRRWRYQTNSPVVNSTSNTAALSADTTAMTTIEDDDNDDWPKPGGRLPDEANNVAVLMPSKAVESGGGEGVLTSTIPDVLFVLLPVAFPRSEVVDEGEEVTTAMAVAVVAEERGAVVAEASSATDEEIVRVSGLLAMDVSGTSCRLD